MSSRPGWKRVAAAALSTLVLAVPVATSSAAELEPTPLPALPAAEVEPNDDAQTASPISSGERIRANLLAAGDVDFYAFAANKDDRVYANVITAATAGSSTDSELRLYGSDGTTVIEFDDNNGSQLNFASSIAGTEIPATGTYYLAVKDFGAGAATELPYDLYFQLRSGTPAAESEPNDGPETADPLGAGEVTGARNPASGAERDFFSLHLDAGDTVFLGLDLDPERDGTHFNGRLGLGMTGDADDLILVVNDAGESEAPAQTIPSEALTMTVSRSGTYYVYVDGATTADGGPTANYRLSATIVEAEQASCRTYESWLSSSFFDGGSIAFGIDVEDPARIARAAVRLDLTQTVMADLDVSLRNPDGVELPLFTDIGATAAGGEEHLEGVFDEFAAVPPAYTVQRPLMQQTEIASRLNWLEGEQAEGEWDVVVRDDNPNGSSGSAEPPELILCPQPLEPVREPIFTANFESGPAGFTHDGTADEWELGLPDTPEETSVSTEAVAGLDKCAQGSACFKTDLDGTYNPESSQDLVSPPISLAGQAGPIAVSWEQWHQLESVRFDHVVVSIEEDGGANRRPLYTWLGPTMSSVLGNVVINPIHASAAGWARHRADVSEYAGKTVRLRFHLDSDDEFQYAGLAIDDVRVFVPGQPDPAEPNLGGPSKVVVTKEPPPPLALTILDTISLKPSAFKAASGGPSLAAGGKPKAGVGSKLMYRLPEGAQTTIQVYRVQKGGRLASVGSLRRSDVAGRVRLRFSGRVGGRKLAPGKYRMALVALAPGKAASPTKTVNFRILP